MSTNLLTGIVGVDGSTAMDAVCKDLLAYREVLAHIMKTCVSEYKDCTIQEIMGYIEGDIQIGNAGVHSDETNLPPKIQGLSTESNSVNESRTYYDVRFSAVAPWGNGERIGLIINVEAQRKYNPGYPLVKRALYYCARMLSAQYGSVFDRSHYESIQKVYSIWICTNPPKERENTITSYTIEEHQLVGGSKEVVRNYDLLNATMVCLGRPEGENYNGLLRMLEVLFSGRHEPKQVIDVLENEYGFSITENLGRSVSDMCNLSMGFFEEGVEKGHKEGRIENQLANLRKIMEKMSFSAEDAMSFFDIPEAEREIYRKLLTQ